MKEFIKGFGSWFVVNALFMYAVVMACIFGSAIGYNFMVGITVIMGIVTLIGYAGVTVMKREAPEKYQEIADGYNEGWHINKYVDIMYDVVIIGIMFYGGFIAIGCIYTFIMFIQNVFKSILTDELNPTVEEIVSEYDESVLERIGIDQNERGR